VPYLSRHVANLPVHSFLDFHPQPRRGDGLAKTNRDRARMDGGFTMKKMNLGLSGPFALDHDPLPELDKGVFIWNSFHLHQIGFGNFIKWGSQAMSKISI
jgi:hypothetical protein